MSADDAPQLGSPLVEWLERHTLSRWTFASDDREIQEREFRYWLGYYGYDETTQPERIDGREWYVRKQ